MRSSSLDYNACMEIVTENGLTFYGINKDLLVYHTGSNTSFWKDIRIISTGSNFLPTENGVEGIVSASIAILDTPEYSGLGDDTRHFVYDIDVENVDTLILSGSDAITSVGIVAHNPHYMYGAYIGHYYTPGGFTCFAALSLIHI